MKRKYLIVFSVALLSSALFSCRKTYNCSCVVNDEKIVTTYEEERKGSVETACDQMEAAAQLEDPKATCTVEED